MNGNFQFQIFCILLSSLSVSVKVQVEGSLAFILNSSTSAVLDQFDVIVVDNYGVDEYPSIPIVPRAHLRWDNLASTQNFILPLETNNLDKIILFFNLSHFQNGSLLTQVSRIFSLLERLDQRKLTMLMCLLWIPHSEDIVTEIKQSFPLHILNLDSDFYIIQESRSEAVSATLEITEIYSVKELRVAQRIYTDFYEIFRKGSRRQDLRGVTICGAGLTFNFLDAVVQYETINGTPHFTKGYAVEKFRLLRDGLNFTEKDELGTGFAHLDEYGEMTGLGKQIIDGLCDISIVSSEMVPFRMEKLTFLFTTEEEKLYAVFHQLPANAFRDIYIHPLSPTLWLCYFCLWIFIIICMFLLLGCLILNNGTIGTRQKFGAIKSVSGDIISWVIATICQQGWYISAATAPVRIAVLSALLSSIIVYVYYCASLVSLLSLHVHPIKSFQNILENKFTLYGENATLAINSLFQAFKKDGIGIIEDENKCYMGTEEGVGKILTTKSAFVSPLYGIDGPLLSLNYTDVFVCSQLTKVQLDGPPGKSGMFINRTSPLKEVLNFKLLQIIENGNHHRLKQKYPLDPVRCLSHEASAIESIGFTDIFTALLVIGSGFGLSACLLVLEKVCKAVILIQ